MNVQLSPYFGDPMTQALQKALDERVSQLADRRGAVVHARTFSSDNPKVLGWNRLRKVMNEEGVITLRGVDEATIELAR